MTKEEIVATKEPCTTAPDATGSRCTCAHDCVNYWMRANGMKAENQS